MASHNIMPNINVVDKTTHEIPYDSTKCYRETKRFWLHDQMHFISLFGLNRILKYCQVPAWFISNQVCYVVIAFAEITFLVNQSRREARHWFNFKSFAFRLSFYIQYCDDQTWDRSFAIWLKRCLVQEPNSDELQNVVHNHLSRNRNMSHFPNSQNKICWKIWYLFLYLPS